MTYLPWYPEWTRYAECAKYSLEHVDEVFFEYGRNGRKIKEAKRICATCRVIKRCYRQNREVPLGIFYGMTAIERWRERGLSGRPTTNDAYSFYGQFYSNFPNGIGSKGPKNNSS